MLPVTDRAAASDAAASPLLYIRSGRKYLPAPADVVLERLRKWAAENFRRGALVLERPEVVEAFLLTTLSTREHEVFAVILLDGQHRLIEYVELFRGTLGATEVYAREVVKAALEHNAAAVILVHNHPSGCAEPSAADVATTQRLKHVLRLVDIHVLDHFVAGETVTSLARRGLLYV